ncbi:MAG: hypothetical protein A3H57_00715 [Candidatus Taylorbacteria bacterium RIFCSPLOWO2_02_FULL_43_11]|uniref:Uncharacterized protein n=1 Tax=Candidatus Taylorbacteria bacterium RIFCSPHIGHO2_02_FULL_43_32b TaxID=1802306 RepID=A0A1G2MKD1_9BACT|nr:MAG: hypothetical protein A2743_01620 [Candidatus Taylorbacteria bacterium RIFCSPHIGHO2_01_FULL_43_47]OHA23442.1 MAG: hypothetical protein A3C72_03710 [Candidatus Taylorbacteria bacterium RIFCSPHIGHO2_02_FULL_43_32b]OHA30458.1 MAG: hypothetical protein A3B08_02725 [Candidatus Taylorbacteria bacterium RIFCSPLOWO2_01_FULL_43_44]OHA36999.1 MAG: hypothetical protein A3H57_00715 [Candidatus Taylorbacteria bacterium RIFCSPLOWO2_02_FULL_43_11]
MKKILTAKQARALTVRAQTKQALKEKQNEVRVSAELVKLKHDMLIRAKKKFPSCLLEVEKEVKKGKFEATIMVARDQRSGSEPWVYFLSRELCLLFEKAKYKTEVITEREDPVGSDPMFPYSVFYTYLKVTW